MENETKQTEVASTETKVEQPKTQEVVTPEKTIPVDVYGIQVELPLSKAKELIAKRDTKTKEYNELKGRITQAEAQAKAESERATLLALMKKQDTEAVEAQVSAKYLDKISKFEKKVFDSEIKSQLAKNGVLADALQDAAKLVMTEVNPELDGDDVKLAGKKVDEFVAEWVKTRPHLVSAKAVDGKKLGKPTTPKAPEKSGADRLNSGLSKFIKA